MPFTWFQLLNFVIILVVLIIMVRYAWGMVSDDHYAPAWWQHEKKAGRIPKELLKTEKRYPDKVRFFNWWFQVERIKREKIPGDFAELGVYKGESARILHLMDPNRKFYLFDTFKGFKADDLSGETGEAASYTPRNFADTSMEKVRSVVGDSPNIVFCPGHFPESAGSSRQPGVGERPYALVNIDADLYQPIRAGLEYFFPRLAPGGVIIVHDYNPKWEGAMRAVDEFMAAIPEIPVMIPDMEGTVLIFKSRGMESL